METQNTIEVRKITELEKRIQAQKIVIANLKQKREETKIENVKLLKVKSGNVFQIFNGEKKLASLEILNRSLEAVNHKNGKKVVSLMTPFFEEDFKNLLKEIFKIDGLHVIENGINKSIVNALAKHGLYESGQASKKYANILFSKGYGLGLKKVAKDGNIPSIFLAPEKRKYSDNSSAFKSIIK